MHAMSWDDLHLVLALARARTLQAAGEQLGVARTTVGRRLVAAEDRLGTRLFDRTPEGMVPTGAGAELVEAAQRLEDEVLAVEGRLRGRDAEPSGALRVSVPELVWDVFTDVFASFVERHPAVRLTVHVGDEMVSLRRREADVVLRLSNDPGDGLQGRKLGRLQFEVYGARALVERVGRGAPLEAFPWVSNDERSPTPWLDRWLSTAAPGARVALRSDAWRVIRRAVSAGLGVHFLACVDGDRDPGLVSLGRRLTGEARALWALTLPELAPNRRVRAFLDHCVEGFAPHRAAMEGERAP
jgi:DNA-binding transcriptional LysR family regulator